MKLSGEQRKILSAIQQESRRIRDPRARRVFLKSAVETGLVESGLRNLPGGDADSAGWRQERAQFYKDPTNIAHSVRRYRQEFERFYDPGEKSYEVSAQVQRPRESLRGRYHDVAGQASQVLRQFGSSGSSAASPSPSSSTSVSYRPGQDRSADRRALMGQYLLNSHDPNALLNLAVGLRGAQDTPGSVKYQTYQTTAATAVEAGGKVDQYKAAADLLDAAKLPYKWGGGHQKNLKLAKGGKPVPVDCSGAVSAVLGIDPRVAAQFQGWGKAGRGKRVTIYAAKDGSHVLMEVNGHFFGTSRANPGGGAGWIPRSKLSKQYLSRFVARHPAGL